MDRICIAVINIKQFVYVFTSDVLNIFQVTVLQLMRKMIAYQYEEEPLLIR